MINNELVVILDFGGQYNQLIARRVRELGVYCEVIPYNTPIDEIKSKNPKGLIFTGGPASVSDDNAPFCDKEIFNIGVPILGICYGMQLIGVMLGGEVSKCGQREYGKTEIEVNNHSLLFNGIDMSTICWMSHTYQVSRLPKDFESISLTCNCQNAAMQNEKRKIYGVQFHPEVEHTPYGKEILSNFLYKICELNGDWKMSSFMNEKIEEIKNIVGDKNVICALSGGVDSSVAAVLVHKAIGKQLTCIFVDHGLLRKFEGDEVERVFKDRFDMNLIRVNAKERFLSKLEGVFEPEQKRKIIGEEFIRVFEEEAKKIKGAEFLVQGTIYPDVIESGKGDAAVIKSHHNVGGLPEDIEFREILEPLSNLFKDEVRKLGNELAIPDDIVNRQPFPGPGLAIRIIGDITEDKLEILKDADYIFREEIKKANIDKDLNQYFAVLTDLKSVGVMGDERTYEYTLALRAVTTNDFMTADWAKMPYDLLERISSRIVNEVKHVNRIVYDITSKPPATIEWE